MPLSLVAMDDGGDDEAGVEEVDVAGCGCGGAEVEWPGEASLHRHQSTVCRARYPSYTLHPQHNLPTKARTLMELQPSLVNLQYLN